MNLLAFDTCFDACSAAVSVNTRGACRRLFHRFEPMATGQAERLLPMIREVLDEAGLTMADIDRIGVTIGPGTFTGTRIAVAAAKGLAIARATPVTGLSSLAVMARQAAITAQPVDDICVVVDVRRGEVYAQLFDATGLIAKTNPALMTIAEARNIALLKNVIFAGNGASLVEPPDASQPYGRSMLPDLLPDARYALELLSQSFQADYAITPLYLRPPDAKPPAPNMLLRQ